MYAKFLIRNQGDLNENDRSYSISTANLLSSYVSRLCSVSARNLLSDSVSRFCQILSAGSVWFLLLVCLHRMLIDFCRQKGAKCDISLLTSSDQICYQSVDILLTFCYLGMNEVFSKSMHSLRNVVERLENIHKNKNFKHMGNVIDMFRAYFTKRLGRVCRACMNI